MAEVELVEVTKRYGAVEACSGVNLRIPEGEFVTLLGPSGCGKTTTLNMIAGLEEITAGDILMDGQRVNDLTPYERDVAMVFQQYALYPHMTVAENIGFTLKLRRRPKAEIAAKVGAVAELLELSPYLDRLPRELSGGQQQRVALGRAIIREPRVFLFDEPFSNLDAALRLKMRAEIKLLHSRLGVTSIFVTHDQEEALSISDRIAVMRQGRVEQYGTPEEVYARPGHDLRGALHRLPADGHPARRDRLGERLERLPRRCGLVSALRSGQPMLCAPFRQRVEPISASAPSTSCSPRLEMASRRRCRWCSRSGPSTVITAAWDGGALTARVPGIAALPPGETVGLRLDPAGLLFFDRETGLRLKA